MSILIIAAHPDDEILGCGGTMARFAAEGAEVNVIFAADGETSRASASTGDIELRKEAARAACKVVGAREPIFLGLPDNQLDTLPLLTVVQKLEEGVKAFQPLAVYTHHAGDLNIDHQIVARAVLTVFRPQPGSRSPAIYGFEVMSSSHWLPDDHAPEFFPRRYVDVSAVFESKIRALNAYSAEMRPSPHARSTEALIALAQFRGAVCGVERAEAFTVIREIVYQGISS